MGIHVNWKHTLETSFGFGNISCILETLMGYWKHNLYIGNIRIRLETESVYWKHNFSLEKNVFFFDDLSPVYLQAWKHITKTYLDPKTAHM